MNVARRRNIGYSSYAGLKQAIMSVHEALDAAKIDPALIGGFALAMHGLNRATGDIEANAMSFMSYLDFLDEYWEIFGPPPERAHVEYRKVVF